MSTKSFAWGSPKFYSSTLGGGFHSGMKENRGQVGCWKGLENIQVLDYRINDNLSTRCSRCIALRILGKLKTVIFSQFVKIVFVIVWVMRPLIWSEAWVFCMTGGLCWSCCCLCWIEKLLVHFGLGAKSVDIINLIGWNFEEDSVVLDYFVDEIKQLSDQTFQETNILLVEARFSSWLRWYGCHWGFNLWSLEFLERIIWEIPIQVEVLRAISSIRFVCAIFWSADRDAIFWILACIFAERTCTLLYNMSVSLFLLTHEIWRLEELNLLSILKSKNHSIYFAIRDLGLTNWNISAIHNKIEMTNKDQWKVMKTLPSIQAIIVGWNAINVGSNYQLFNYPWRLHIKSLLIWMSVSQPFVTISSGKHVGEFFCVQSAYLIWFALRPNKTDLLSLYLIIPAQSFQFLFCKSFLRTANMTSFPSA